MLHFIAKQGASKGDSNPTGDKRGHRLVSIYVSLLSSLRIYPCPNPNCTKSFLYAFFSFTSIELLLALRDLGGFGHRDDRLGAESSVGEGRWLLIGRSLIGLSSSFRATLASVLSRCRPTDELITPQLIDIPLSETAISQRPDEGTPRPTSIPRSRTGCLTCYVKKIKCDETPKPICMWCTHGQRDCSALGLKAFPPQNGRRMSMAGP
ncbi:hypothetical protein L210DRAFT_2112261 [Boletus edulis BED1]|uniref:Zn(2)-C6 fungal-type domain-containing protein n=1 Tax=Boletus edulis BED1 TaxID=1328754 RepID=A0AAD4BDS4_BOLED|nr:hypothetical protein L210DRAFT_2140405 [Boletus edulis BED1]KAF8423459.1 hypothetical protein L210DRAFT_2141934 [Boletus edulis BED1]KAF8440769.1 hypothetical protein L210DRAFT_2112261 [Boletus edulis BED1]